MACFPTCEKFIRLNQTPYANLRLMEKSIQETPTLPFSSGSFNTSNDIAAFSSFIGKMQNDYKLPRYGLSTQWLIFVRDRECAAQVLPGSSGPVSIFGQIVAMIFTTINISTIFGTIWTAAMLAVTSASAPVVKTVQTVTTQQMAISNSKSMHSAASISLLKPIPVPTQTQPAMATISKIDSTTAV